MKGSRQLHTDVPPCFRELNSLIFTNKETFNEQIGYYNLFSENFTHDDDVHLIQHRYVKMRTI